MERFPHVPIICTRGCPYACTFCSVPLVAGKPVRRRSPQLVMAEVHDVVRRFGIRELSIVDDSFAQHRDVVVDFCEGLRRERFDLTWNCYNGLRLRALDPDLMKLMWDTGCHGISVGIESGSDRMLKLIKKHLTKADIVEKVRMIKRTVPKMKILGFFILGQPGELPSDVDETIQLSRDLPLDLARFSLYTPHPGTESWKELLAAGRFSAGEYHSNEDILSCEAKGRSQHYTGRQLRRWYMNAVFGFHLRPRVALGIARQLMDLRKVGALARTLKTFVMATPP
jgi:anaerobic magnesium-protoporphyrin IX monomethyl ester cyclase